MEMILERLSVYWSVGAHSNASAADQLDLGSIGSDDRISAPGVDENAADLILQQLDCMVKLKMQGGGADAMLSVSATVPQLTVHLQPHQVETPLASCSLYAR